MIFFCCSLLKRKNNEFFLILWRNLGTKRFLIFNIWLVDVSEILKNQIYFNTDRRVEEWPLMSSPLPTVLICLIYVLTVKVWGPRLMRDRPAFELRRTLIVYNFVQVLFSAWIFRLVWSNTTTLYNIIIIKQKLKSII